MEKKYVDVSSSDEVMRLRDVEKLWAAPWFFAELRDMRESGSRFDAAERA